jgi:hypothetical protein
VYDDDVGDHGLLGGGGFTMITDRDQSGERPPTNDLPCAPLVVHLNKKLRALEGQRCGSAPTQ